MVTGIVPHVGGPFILGSFTVIVGGMPQSKVGDTLICVGPPDVLVMGAPTVQVGMVGGGGGFGAAMAGLAMAAGGLLSGGYPKAELQPDGSIVTQYNSQITITGSAQYQATVIRDLNTFLSSATGQNWQSAYSSTGRHVTISPIPASMDQGNSYTWSGPPDATGNYTSGADPNGSVQRDASGNITGPGSGADSTVLYNPSRTPHYHADDGSYQEKSPDTVLGHELTHALHNGQGTGLNGEDEEAQTIGYGSTPIPGGPTDNPTENDYLDEQGLPDRADHSGGEQTFQDASGNWHHRYTDASGGHDDIIPAPANARPSQ
jgi:uncharacterized Zn-binding protein involved in type VI secretion